MTKSAGKSASSLRVEDLKKHPVWQFVTSDDCELCVTPVRRLPASSLRGKLLATRVSLADGTLCWALFGNLNDKDPRLSEIFLTVSIWHGNRWFYLARYFDSDYGKRGPRALARFLNRPLNAVFPIRYDLRPLVKSRPEHLSGQITKLPRTRLSREKIIALAVASASP